MNEEKNKRKGVLDVLFLIFFTIVIAIFVQKRPKKIDTGLSNSPQPYPYQPYFDQSYPYPPPDDQLTSTPTLQPSPTIAIEYGPPPGWPTDQPWPPDNSETIIVKNHTTPFPTPEFTPEPQGERPAELDRIIYTYYPRIDSIPIVQAVEIDHLINRWRVLDQVIGLELPGPIQGPDPGPILVNFHLSPNQKWLVSDFAYRGSQLIDLSTGKLITLFPNDISSKWQFLDWDDFGEKLIASSNHGYQKIDLLTGYSEYFPALNFTQENIYLNAITVSHDDKLIADAVIYPATLGIREIEIAEIGLRNEIDGKREVLWRAEGGIYIVENSLKWSPDGKNLIWIVVVTSDVEYEVQLWLYNLSLHESHLLEILSKSSQYFHQALWSPNGDQIAAITEERISYIADAYRDQVVILDHDNAGRNVIAQSVDGDISHLAWSPDGEWVAYTLSNSSFGEIWVAKIDGSKQFPVAGPTLPNTPFIWLP
jgi:WD40 repeat protein